ncbi:SGNH/GDSL hydrolase family protein [Aquimarina sp. M1]
MKKLKLKFISIFLGLILGLFLGEIFSRIYFFGTAAFSYSKVNSFSLLDNSGLLQYSDTDGLKYELLPNLNTKYKLADFHTNNEGFRDRNHTSNSKAYKIAVLGDSFTMGTGVSEDEMYVIKTEEILNKKASDTIYDVFNFGVSGYALNNYITILKKEALQYDPDLVVIGFCASNDHYKIGTDFSLDTFRIKPKKNVFWDSYLKKLLQIKLFSPAYKPIIYESHQLNFVNDKFKELQQILEENNIKGLIFYLDLVYDPIRVQQIKELSIRNNLFFLDISILFKEKELSNYIVNELDPHPNGRANLIFAKALKDFILQNEHVIFNE